MKNRIHNKTIKFLLSIILIIFAAYLLSIKYFRIDLTSEGRFTLSEYTKTILENLDDKVYIKVYLTGDGLPTTLKRYRREIKEELDEFKIYAEENLEFEFIDPSESSDNEVKFAFWKSLTDKGLLPIETIEVSDDGKTSSKMVFPGASVNYKGKEAIVNLLKTNGRNAPESEESVNNSIQSLEYELTNAIQKLSKKTKEKIAFIEGHGELNEYQLMDISTILSEYYTVMTGSINGTPGILDEFKAIIIANPQFKFPEEDKFIIDQYIMKGGNVMWLIDGVKTSIDSLFITGSTLSLAQDLNLNDMLFQYGVRVNHDLIMDAFSSPIGITTKGPDGNPLIKHFPWYYFPVLVSDNNHSISKYLNYIRTEFTSTIDTVGLQPGITKTILLHSSEHTKFEPIPARISLDQLNNMPAEYEMNSGRKAIAVLLEGKFSSVFNNRPVESYIPGVSNADVITNGKDAKMIIVSDGDIIRNEVSSEGEIYPIGFDRFTQNEFVGNKEFILNSINYLCDDEGLMTIRSRELQMRLLDRESIQNKRFVIQFMNVLLPVILLSIFGLLILFIRRKRYK